MFWNSYTAIFHAVLSKYELNSLVSINMQSLSVMQLGRDEEAWTSYPVLTELKTS